MLKKCECFNLRKSKYSKTKQAEEKTLQPGKKTPFITPQLEQKMKMFNSQTLR